MVLKYHPAPNGLPSMALSTSGAMNKRRVLPLPEISRKMPTATSLSRFWLAVREVMPSTAVAMLIVAARSVPRHQPGHLISASNQYCALPLSGEQRAHPYFQWSGREIAWPSAQTVSGSCA